MNDDIFDRIIWRLFKLTQMVSQHTRSSYSYSSTLIGGLTELSRRHVKTELEEMKQTLNEFNIFLNTLIAEPNPIEELERKIKEKEKEQQGEKKHVI